MFSLRFQEDDQLCESKPSTSLAKDLCKTKKNNSSPFMIPSKKSSSSNSDIYEWDKIHRIVEVRCLCECEVQGII